MLKKSRILVLLAMIVMLISCAAFAADGDVEINEDNFPDEAFREWLLNNVDNTYDVISAETIATTTDLNVAEQGI